MKTGQLEFGEDATESQKRMYLTFTVVILIVFLLRIYLFQLYYIPSESMEQTLKVNDKIAVAKVHGEIERGDIVVFKDPGGWLEGNEPGDDKLIKRVIGVSGDHVECCSPSGKLLLNEEELNEPYLSKSKAPSYKKFDIQVKPGHLWVMGDNRDNSADSRYNKVSQVPLENVVGVAKVKIYPDIDLLK